MNLAVEVDVCVRADNLEFILPGEGNKGHKLLFLFMHTVFHIAGLF